MKTKAQIKRKINSLNKLYKFKNEAQLVNMFYSEFLDIEKFQDYKQYEFLLMSDRHPTNSFSRTFSFTEKINFLIENRAEFLYD